MTNLPDGLYDLLITQAVEREIARLAEDRRADIEPLPEADANLILGRYIGEVLREALRGVPETDRLQRQAEIVNEVLRGVAASLPDHVDEGDSIPLPPQRLAALYRFDPLRSARPASPEIPLGQSAFCRDFSDRCRSTSSVRRMWSRDKQNGRPKPPVDSTPNQ